MKIRVRSESARTSENIRKKENENRNFGDDFSSEKKKTNRAILSSYTTRSTTNVFNEFKHNKNKEKYSRVEVRKK
ncbi:MAG: hypothetical protein VXV85_08050, partial [Candidatus Thermoplasmatota archaeon]|nr:hypothetical protein [Candidatus Thermoplasmatota archaeon]